ncbi:MAG TPA: WD40 repeat domain-containing protein, partial [Aridibacter sp.]|nr:WD40 repeat domain-containing protein [Aridibacter sp.]
MTLNSATSKLIAAVVAALALVGFSLSNLNAASQQEALNAQLVVQTGHTIVVTSISFADDNSTLVTGGFEGSLIVWDPRTGKELKSIASSTNGGVWSGVRSVDHSPNNKSVVSYTADGYIRVWDLLSGSEIVSFYGNSGTPRNVEFLPDGQRIASAGSERVVVWDATTGEEIWSKRSKGNSLSADLSVSPDGGLIGIGNLDGSAIEIVKSGTGESVKTLVGLRSRAVSMSFSPDNKTLAVAVMDNKVLVFDLDTGLVQRSLERPGSSFAKAIRYSGDGGLLYAVGGWDISVWDISRNYSAKKIRYREHSALETELSGDQKVLAVSHLHGRVELYDTENGAAVESLSGRAALGTFRSMSPDGKYLALGGIGQFRFIDLSTGEVDTIKASPGVIFFAGAFTPDGKQFAIGGNHRSISLWDVAERKLRRRLDPSISVTSLSFSQDGRFLAAGERNNKVVVLDLDSDAAPKVLIDKAATLKPIRTLLSLALSPDGKLVASGSADSTIKLFDVLKGKVLATLRGHSGGVASLTFSPDSKVLASESFDGTIRLWSTVSGETLGSFPYDGAETIETVRKSVPDFYRNSKRFLLTPNGKFRIAGEPSSRLAIQDGISGVELGGFVAFNGDDWAVTTPGGLFDASPGGRDTLHYVVGLETVTLEQMKEAYYVPGLLQKIFKGEPLP